MYTAAWVGIYLCYSIHCTVTDCMAVCMLACSSAAIKAAVVDHMYVGHVILASAGRTIHNVLGRVVVKYRASMSWCGIVLNLPEYRTEWAKMLRLKTIPVTIRMWTLLKGKSLLQGLEE